MTVLCNKPTRTFGQEGEYNDAENAGDDLNEARGTPCPS